MNIQLYDFFKDKRVLITGHTGFKGAWLALMLKELGAILCGFSLPPENIRGNLFEEVKLADQMESHFGDICDYISLKKVFDNFQPEIVLHLAAQAIVFTGYANPIDTFNTNAQGTVHILECVRHSKSCKAIVCITTDKCYENKEWYWAYREIDVLGGKDPYSASKAMAELAIYSYRKSYFTELGIGCASARAGNVIGGGDYATFRIMPDIAEAISKNKQIFLRNPLSIRPWQHVLDALYGYLILTKKLYEEPEKYAKAYNFAPFKDGKTYTVQRVAEIYLESLGLNKTLLTIETKSDYKPEATLLQLDPSLANVELGWVAKLSVPEAVEWTAKWFEHKENSQIDELTFNQIKIYLKEV